MGAPPDLDHRAGRGIDLGIPDGLDRVDHQDVGLDLPDGRLDPGHGGLGDHPDVGHEGVQALGPPAHLGRRLLGRHQQAALAASGDGRQHLQHQRRLADPRLTAEQRDRSGDQSAAEHAVELADPGRCRVARVTGELGQRHRRAHPDVGPTPGPLRPKLMCGPAAVVAVSPLDLLDERVPLAAHRHSAPPSEGPPSHRPSSGRRFAREPRPHPTGEV